MSDDTSEVIIEAAIMETDNDSPEHKDGSPPKTALVEEVVVTDDNNNNNNNNNNKNNVDKGSRQPPPPQSPSASRRMDASKSSKPAPPSKSPRTPRGGKGGSSSTTGNDSTKPRRPRKSSSSSGSEKHRKKGIIFKRTVGVHTIPNLSTYTVTEKEITWYAADEYGDMEDECDLTAELMDGRSALWPGHSSRGLEAWTTEGEQRKEGHVQLAIDIVWQAQLEQWKASSDISECWEFIRSRYLAVSKPCHKLANTRGLHDEQEVKSYLAGVRHVEKNRLRLLGIHHRSGGARKIHRSSAGGVANDEPLDQAASTPKSYSKKKIGRMHSEKSPTTGRLTPGRHHSSDNIKVPGKSLLKVSLEGDEDQDGISKRGSSGSQKAASRIKNSSGADDDEVSVASSRRSTGSGRKKISYQPKSRSKVPVSPVGSLVTDADSSDENSASRRMRSHMSVSSEDSTRRRMLRTASLKPLS